MEYTLSILKYERFSQNDTFHYNRIIIDNTTVPAVQLHGKHIFVLYTTQLLYSAAIYSPNCYIITAIKDGLMKVKTQSLFLK